MQGNLSRLAFLAVLTLAACDSSQNTESLESSAQTASSPGPARAPEASLKPGPRPSWTPEKIASLSGYYVGLFKAENADPGLAPMYLNKITLSIDAIHGDRISGHSVVAGTIRGFNGIIFASGPESWQVRAQANGDQLYEGQFSFQLDSQNLKGSWQANNSTLPGFRRSYTLKKHLFKYNPNLALRPHNPPVQETGFAADWHKVYFLQPTVVGLKQEPELKHETLTDEAIKLNASARILKLQDVEKMYRRDLEIMRNAIYARHGYSFQNLPIRNFFDVYVDWYLPLSKDVSRNLTQIEKQNIALIKRYERSARSHFE